MLIDDSRQVEAAARRILAQVNDGSASCEQMREAMPALKSASAMITAAQTSAAASISGSERHGDGGAEVLAAAAGLPIGEARSQVKTAETLRDLPGVRDAVESGRVSQANAKRLAAAVDKAGAKAVEADGELLAKAKSLRPEQFRRVARRWTAEREGGHGESEHARQRARRCVRVWHNDDDGMVHLRGEFDTVTGNQIANRLRAEARRLHDTDKKHAAGNGVGRRSFDQCMADALDHLTSTAGASSRGSKPFADICVVAHVDDATGELIAELPDGERLPAAVLEQLSCNAKLTGVVHDRKGKPIWRTHSRRTVTESQWQLLIAKYGGCFHCGANPGICQGHHIEPASQGGPTKLDNLVPACWRCHHRIHHDNWQIRKSPDGWHTLHPPDPVNYGPAHAPEHPPPLFRPDTRHSPDTSTRRGSRGGRTANSIPSPRVPMIGADLANGDEPQPMSGPGTARATLHKKLASAKAAASASGTERLFDPVEAWSAGT